MKDVGGHPSQSQPRASELYSAIGDVLGLDASHIFFVFHVLVLSLMSQTERILRDKSFPRKQSTQVDCAWEHRPRDYRLSHARPWVLAFGSLVLGVRLRASVIGRSPLGAYFR